MTVTLRDFLASPDLLGAVPAFQDLRSWRAWLAFYSALYGDPMPDGESERLFLRCTSLPAYSPPPGGYREAAVITGRQSGKTYAAAALCVFEAATAPIVRDGHQYVLLLAQDHRAAVRTAFGYLSAFFDASEPLRSMVVNRTSDTLELENGIRLAAYPCRPASVRGLRARLVVLDELAYYRSSEMLPLDVETLRAARPTLATTGGRLVVLSSPYGQSGALWELHRRHYGRESGTLVWQADARKMHPGLPADYLQRMRTDDPDAYRSEVQGEFRAGLASLLDPQVIDDAVVHGRRELPPQANVVYRAFADMSGGRRDAAALAIGHVEGHGEGRRAVVDVLRRWPAPHNPGGVAQEMALLCRQYRVARVTADRFAAGFSAEAFAAAGLQHAPSEKAKSDLYLGLLSTMQSGALELPEDGTLVRELRALERRRGSAGRDRVDHPPGGHDDAANVVAGLADLLLRRTGGATWRDLYPGRPARRATG